MTAQTVDTSKLWDMIKDIRLGMLTVRGADGRPYARPMTTQVTAKADRGGVSGSSRHARASRWPISRRRRM